jgi:hypothetical protein
LPGGGRWPLGEHQHRYGFYIEDDRFVDHDVCTVFTYQQTFLSNRQGHTALERNLPQREFMSKRMFIHALEESRSRQATHFLRRTTHI